MNKKTFVGRSLNVHNAPISVLRQLSKDADIRVRGWVGANNNTDMATLEALGKDENEGARTGVVMNAKCSPSILESLAEDSSNDVRYRVARHSNTPVSVLRKFANSSEEVIGWNLAANRSLPVEIQRDLVNRNDTRLNRNLAGNKGVDEQVLREIYAGSSDDHLMDNMVLNESTPVSLLSEFVGTYKDDIKMKSLVSSAARSSRTPASDLETLGKSKFGEVVRAVAVNPHTPKHVLQ